jgi:hypothetical protein
MFECPRKPPGEGRSSLIRVRTCIRSFRRSAYDVLPQPMGRRVPSSRVVAQADGDEAREATRLGPGRGGDRQGPGPAIAEPRHPTVDPVNGPQGGRDEPDSDLPDLAGSWAQAASDTDLEAGGRSGSSSTSSTTSSGRGRTHRSGRCKSPLRRAVTTDEILETVTRPSSTFNESTSQDASPLTPATPAQDLRNSTGGRIQPAREKQ